MAVASSGASVAISNFMTWKKGNRLPLVTEAQAQGRIREIYDEIKEALGLPYVNVVFQVFAGLPHFLELHWQLLKPIVQTQTFFTLADRIRADAYTRMHNYFEIPDMCAEVAGMQFSEGARQELSNAVDLLQYNDPLLLLIIIAQMQAFEGAVGDSKAPREPSSHPVFPVRPVVVDESSVVGETKRIFEEIKRSFGVPVVITDYRILARWPDFLRVYWKTLRPAIESPLYHQCENGIRETAWALARELPGPFELPVSSLEEAGVDENDIGSIVRLTDLFSRMLSSTLLNVSMAKIGIEGGNRLPATEETKSERVPAENPAA